MFEQLRRRPVVLAQAGAVVFWNAMPVWGVVVGDWPALAVLLLYWAEVGVIVVLGTVRAHFAVYPGTDDPGEYDLRARLWMHDYRRTALGGAVLLGFWSTFGVSNLPWIDETGVAFGPALSTPGLAWAIGGVCLGHVASTAYEYFYRGNYVDADRSAVWKRTFVYVLSFFAVSALFGNVVKAFGRPGLFVGVVGVAAVKTTLEFRYEFDPAEPSAPPGE